MIFLSKSYSKNSYKKWGCWKVRKKWDILWHQVFFSKVDDATPTRWRFVRGYDKPTGVASHLLSRWYIIIYNIMMFLLVSLELWHSFWDPWIWLKNLKTKISPENCWLEDVSFPKNPNGPEFRVSNEKRAPGWLAYIGDEILPNYISGLFHELWNKDPVINQPGFNGK